MVCTMAAIATPSFVRSRNRILIASADAEFRKHVMKNPVYAGSYSEEALGGAHALAKLLQFPCDSVLIDRNLPDLDALEGVEKIHKKFPRMGGALLDARAVSAKAQDSEVREASNAEFSESPALEVATPAESVFSAGHVEALPGMI